MNRIAELREQFFQALPENIRLERIWFIAKTDFKKRYYGSFLGLLWALFNPLMQMAVYYIVFTVVFESDEPYFSLFLFCGLIHFLYFVESATKGMTMFNSKRYLLENIQINEVDVYYANLLASFMGFLFNFLVFMIFRFLFIPEMPGKSIMLYPVLVLNLILFTHGISLTLSVIWVHFRDVVHIWNIIRLALMWLSGIFFAIELTPGANTKIFAYLTPISGIVLHIRSVTMYDAPIYWDIFWYDIIYALIVVVIGNVAYRMLGRRALERL